MLMSVYLPVVVKDLLGNVSEEKMNDVSAWINSLFIFIQPPSVEELKKRLQTRGSETVESLNARINKSAFELSFKNNFENVVVNNNLEKACAEAEAIVSSFINK